MNALVIVLLLVAGVAVVGYAGWRVTRKPEHDGLLFEQPIEGKADVVAARLERIADSLEMQAEQLRQAVSEVKGEAHVPVRKIESKGEKGGKA